MLLKTKANRRSGVMALLASIFMVGTAVPTMAFEPKAMEEIRFQVHCSILLWTDPVAHEEICGSGPFGTPKSLSDESGSDALPPPPPPAPTEEVDDDECPTGMVVTACGCQYLTET